MRRLFFTWCLVASATALLHGQSNASPSRITLTLATAVARAKQYAPVFQSAVINTALAREDKVQARSLLLPNVNTANQFLYTQGNGTPSGRFVANNGVHVYSSQGILHQDLVAIFAHPDYRRTVAAEAAAFYRQEIAARGLVLIVAQAYYGLVTAQRRVTNSQQSLAEARRFLDVTSKQEQGGEVAHADVVKAQLQALQRQRDLDESTFLFERSKLALAVLLSPDLNTDFDVEDDLQTIPDLIAIEEVRRLASTSSPDVKAAELQVDQARYSISATRLALFPSLTVDYYYGLNANTYSVSGPNGERNLGYAGAASLNLPVWNWGASRSRVRQANLRRDQAQLDLSVTRRQVLANAEAFHREAELARNQVTSLQETLRLSNESLRLTTLRYEAGEATALEVADAQTTLALARNGYDDGLVRYRLALAAVQTITGTL